MMADNTAEVESVYPDLSTATNPDQDASPVNLDEARRAEMEKDLAKTEEEIATLRQVLHAKEQHAAELKRDLGLTALSQIKAELNKVQSSQAYQSTQAKVSELNEKVTSSEYYKKTSETLKSAGQATATVFNTIGTSMSNKLSEMKNSQTFKSFEEKVEGVGSSIMAKVSGTPKDGTSTETPTNPDAPEDPVTKQPLPADDLPM